MASRAYAFVLVIGLLGVAGAAPAAGEARAPSIRPGDSWTYRTNTTFEEGFYFAGTATFAIAAQETVALGGGNVDAFRVLVSGEGTVGGRIPTELGPIPVAGAWNLVGEQAIEAEGLKIVSSFLTFDATGETPIAFSIRVRNFTAVEILEDRWRFPIDAGSEGSLTEAFDTWENFTLAAGSLLQVTNVTGSGERTLAYRVEATTTVQVPAGNFAAYRINETWPDGRYGLMYFAAAAGNNVRTESYNRTGSRVASADLESYRYQALEPETFLGLAAVQWALLAPAIAASAVGIVWIARRQRDRRAPRIPPPGA